MENLIFYGYEFFCSFIPFFITIFLRTYKQKRNGAVISNYYYIIMMFLAFYITGVYHVTSAGTLYDIFRYQLEIRTEQIQVIPFSNHIDIIAYLLNILLFVPLGILIPICYQKSNYFRYVLITGFAFSFFIEMTQLLNYRKTDIDDIIVNTSGAVIGLLLYKIWERFTKRKLQPVMHADSELPVYIAVMFLGRFFLFNEMGLARLLYHF